MSITLLDRRNSNSDCRSIWIDYVYLIGALVVCISGKHIFDYCLIGVDGEILMQCDSSLHRPSGDYIIITTSSKCVKPKRRARNPDSERYNVEMVQNKVRIEVSLLSSAIRARDFFKQSSKLDCYRCRCMSTFESE